MSDLPDAREPRDEPPRPLLRPTPLERARSWVQWVGLGRLAGTAVVVLAVLAAAYWLVKPPPATTESTLPFARSASTTEPPAGGVPTDGTGPADDVPTGSTTPPSGAGTTTGDVVVHVAGAVASSGVYRLPAGSRVIDAVQSAGGLAPDAQPDAVNLAALLADGERVYVPRLGEEVSPIVATTPGSTVVAGPVNLNSASADELDSLPGIGPATAAAIIAHRDLHGPFASLEDLAEVRGIGPAKIEALRGLVTT